MLSLCQTANITACVGRIIFIGPEPRIGITKITLRAEVHVQPWADNARRKLWQSTDDCRQAKMFLPGPDKQLLRFALGLKRRQLRILVGLLIGYITLSRHYFDCYKDTNRSTILSMCRREGNVKRSVVSIDTPLWR